MKKITAILFFVVLYTTADAQLVPVMTFDSTTINYGIIDQGSNPYREFKFKNTGAVPLVIIYVNSSCGCTIPSYPKEPVMPDENKVIKVRYDTNIVGPFNKRLTLTTNCGDEPIILYITGTVNKIADVAPLPPTKQE